MLGTYLAISQRFPGRTKLELCDGPTIGSRRHLNMDRLLPNISQSWRLGVQRAGVQHSGSTMDS